MAHDPTATPTAVLHRCQRANWHGRHVDALPELVADPYRRHYPCKVETLSDPELLARIRYSRRGLTDVRFHRVPDVAEGPYVTTAWDSVCTTKKAQRPCISGIEIFMGEQGHITGVWNGHAHDGEWAWNLLWDRTVEPADVPDVQDRVTHWGTTTGMPVG